MDLRDCCNILMLFFLTLTWTAAQVTEVRCINPDFDQLVDDYLDYSVPIISVADAYEARKKYVFLDAREKEEFATSHISDAIHIGYDDFEIDTVIDKIPKDSELIVYCSIGYRSEKIGKKLKKYGYTNVYNLYGSIFEWVNQHHPVFDTNNKSTNKLHTYSKKWSKWVGNEDIEKVW